MTPGWAPPEASQLDGNSTYGTSALMFVRVRLNRSTRPSVCGWYSPDDILGALGPRPLVQT